MNFGNSLKISGYCLKLNAEAPIAGNGKAVLSDHRNECAPIVLSDLQQQIKGKNPKKKNTNKIKLGFGPFENGREIE